MNGSLAEDGECAAVAEVDVERVSFGGMVTHFRGLTPYEKKIIHNRSASDERLPFCMNIGLASEGTIFIELTPLSYENIRVCKCVLHLLDSTGNETKCGESTFVYRGEKPDKEWTFPLMFSKGNLLEHEKQYLPNDCLSLQCEIAFCTEKISSKIIKTKYATKLLPDNCSRVMQNHSKIEGEENQCTVKDDLLSLLSTGMLADVKLQTVTGTFHAHKNILSARSLAFQSIFTTNISKDCVQIDDLDADTLRRLLLYSDSLQDLDFESAKKMHFAAVKYRVFALRRKCSRFLEESLCPSNCCDVLLLAHEHCDSYLKKAVQEYIARHDKDVLRTSEWRNLEGTHPSLIIETFHIIYQRNRGNL
ncbi:hypothetical protein AVEN_205314-1 [Araneus ventricosus]|uniref:BTB domain-containing protein n=1 Tax=Araneus ventricosus TaxID=182803 RepID=A0A4Y2K6E0_ARAVE|nr:hypothetical protein AVEN_205314-1 [Araneus ventricosus]